MRAERDSSIGNLRQTPYNAQARCIHPTRNPGAAISGGRGSAADGTVVRALVRLKHAPGLHGHEADGLALRLPAPREDGHAAVLARRREVIRPTAYLGSLPSTGHPWPGGGSNTVSPVTALYWTLTSAISPPCTTHISINCMEDVGAARDWAGADGESKPAGGGALPGRVPVPHAAINAANARGTIIHLTRIPSST